MLKKGSGKLNFFSGYLGGFILMWIIPRRLFD